MAISRWSSEQVELAKHILRRHTSVLDAAVEISRTLGRQVSSSALKHALLARGERPPSDYLMSQPLVQTGPGLSDLVGFVKTASALNDTDAHDLTASQVAKCTPCNADDFTRYGGYAKIVEDAFEPTVKPNLADREGLAARVAYTRRLERALGQRDYLGNVVQKSITEAFATSPVRLSTTRYIPPGAPGRRLLTAMVSDAHLGLIVDPKEVPGSAFDWTIAARRFALFATQISDWKPYHRDETDLLVVFNGDMICGRIHLDDRGVTLLTEQIHGAAAILVAFLDYLKQHFANIRVIGLPGNHERATRERQVSQRWDNHSSSIYLAIKMAFRDTPGISFEIPKTGEGVVELPGGDALALFSHGDVRPSISNVGKSLNIKPMVETIHRINASGEFAKPVRVLGYGHFHTPFTMPTGIATIVVNGSVIGVDSFARYGAGIRGDDGAPMQVMFESTPGFPFGDCRFVHLKPADDDEALDAVIPTPSLDRM